jgi:hypothetical protein
MHTLQTQQHLLQNVLKLHFVENDLGLADKFLEVVLRELED